MGNVYFRQAQACASGLRPPQRSNPHLRILDQLVSLATDGDPALTISVVSSETTPWASATFTGARHHGTLRLAGETAQMRADRFAHILPEAEFALPGQIVADITVDRVAHGIDADGTAFALVRIAALTIEDW